MRSTLQHIQIASYLERGIKDTIHGTLQANRDLDDPDRLHTKMEADLSMFAFGAQLHALTFLSRQDQIAILNGGKRGFSNSLQLRTQNNLNESIKRPNDWFKNKKGDIVWFNSSAKKLKNSLGNWKNIGANKEEVKENLNIPDNKNVTWNSISAVALGGSDRIGNRGGGFGVVTLNNKAIVSFDFKIEGSEGMFGSKFIDGKTRIVGIDISIIMSSGTGAPGLQLTHVGGKFGLKKWSTRGKINTNNSSNFEPLSYPTISNNLTHTSGIATMHLSLFRYRVLSRNFSRQPILNLGINSTIGFRIQTSEDWNTPKLSTRFFDISKTIKF